ncbi:hypothetical protein [Agrobacterium rosae]|uniref:SinR family protein n=1 Tax=Agrobacterium rosae TaxID=1972867 RepID=A0AAW9FCX7_9HYPH|nr:hypothetical protein [Agrobacterium rosae]MDX8301447.1 hypothetical protein [Agrobacterium rosae]
MTKYFTVAIEGLTASQEKQVVESWKGYGWWHGIANFWLLRDHSDTLTAATIRSDLKLISSNAKIIVLEVDPKTWAGMSMTESNRSWLRKWWPPEGA